MKPELLITQTNDVPVDRFYVSVTKDKIDDGEILLEDNVEISFCGGKSLGELFFGWGIVRALVESGKQAVLMFRPNQKYTLPGDQDGDQ